MKKIILLSVAVLMLGFWVFIQKRSQSSIVSKPIVASDGAKPTDDELKLFAQADSKEFSKRLSALREIGLKQSPARLSFLVKHKERKNISDMERLTARVAILKISPDAVQREKELSEIYKMEESTKSELIKAQVFIQLAYIAPSDKRTIQIAKRIKKAGDPKIALPVAVKLLHPDV
jgi:hypothetical protein